LRAGRRSSPVYAPRRKKERLVATPPALIRCRFDEAKREEVPVAVLYITTSGAGDPTRASIGFHLAANGSVEAAQKCAVALVGDATELVSRDTAAQVEGVGFRPAGELLQKLVDNEVPVYV
jgi:hypothetical protein